MNPDKKNLTIFKVIVWIAIVASEILTYSLFFYGVDSSSGRGSMYFILSATSLIMWSAFLGFGVIFLTRWQYALAIFAGVIPSLIYFENSYVSLISIIIFTLLCLMPYVRARYDYRTRTIFYPAFIIKKIAPATLTLFALLMAVMAYQSFGEVTPQDIMPQSVVEAIMQHAGNIFSFYFEVPVPGEGVDAFLEKNLSRQGVDLGELSEYQKLLLIDSSRKGLAESFGIEIDGDERMGDVVYNLFSEYVNQYIKGYEQYFVWVFSFGFFILLKTIFIPIGWISMIVFWIIIKAGMFLGIVKIERDNVLQEKLVI